MILHINVCSGPVWYFRKKLKIYVCILDMIKQRVKTSTDHSHEQDASALEDLLNTYILIVTCIEGQFRIM